MSSSTEAQPRVRVDAALASAGWILQDGNQADPSAGYAIAVRRYPLAFSPTHGNSDYLLYVSGVALGVVRILPQLPPLKDPDDDESPVKPPADEEDATDDNRVLPSAEPLHWQVTAKPSSDRRKTSRVAFVYETDGVHIHFRDARQQLAAPYLLYHFHRPVALAAWVTHTPIPMNSSAPNIPVDPEKLSEQSLLERLDSMPRIADRALWAGERLVLEALQTSLRRGKRRILAQMAPGSGKTHTLLNLAYELLEHAHATRILMLVDNDPLAYQTAEEFRTLRPPAHATASATPLPFDIGPHSHTLPVQQLSGHHLDPAARLVISSPYRLLASWHSGHSHGDTTVSHTTFSSTTVSQLPVVPGIVETDAVADAVAPYCDALPMETFDVILCDDLSPATLHALRPVLNYFDAPILAISGTPCRSTLEFFHNRISAEYPYEQAIADGAILPFETYAIRVKEGFDQKLEATAGPLEIHRQADVVTRLTRWQQTEDLVELLDDNAIENDSENHDHDTENFTELLALRDRLPREIFPHRKQVPKTLIITRDQRHAESILELCSEIFSGEDFFARILTTPAPQVSGDYSDVVFRAAAEQEPRPHGEPRTPSPDAHYPYLTAFRSDVFPRIGIVPIDSFAVTVDLRPAEILVLMAGMESRAHFEAVKARVIRTVRRAEFLRVTPDAHAVAGKTHAMIIDTVGMFDTEAPSETYPLDRRPTVPLAQLLQEVAFSALSEHTVRSLAARFLELDCLLTPAERDSLAKAAGGATLHTLAMRLIIALDADRQIAHASRALRGDARPTSKMVEQAAAAMLQQAVARIHSGVELRSRIIQLDRQYNPKPREDDGPEEIEEAPVEDIGNEETWR